MPNRNVIALRYDLKMQADAPDRAEIMIYGEVTPYKWDETDVTAMDFDRMLKEAKASGAKNLTLRINSPGGSVFQAEAMRVMLENSSFDSIDVSIEGLCASAATLFVTLDRAHVSMSSGSMFMIHNPSSIVWGTAKDMEDEAALLHKMEGSFRAMYAKKCGRDEAEIKNWMDDETWFTAVKAVEAGFVDTISGYADIAACVNRPMMDAMRDMYAHVPNAVKTAEAVSNTEAVVAPATVSENNNGGNHTMEINEITAEMLASGNPDVYQAVMRAGAEAERERIDEIDSLTPPGYESMAAEAKANGTSAMDYHKSIIKAQREKGMKYMQDRAEETKPAGTVTASAVEDEIKDDTLDTHAKHIADIAAKMGYGSANKSSNNTMY